jgi:hypothetical protein
MSWNDYEMENLDDPSSPAGNAMRALAAKDPHRLDRLLTALEDFTATPLTYADRLSPPHPNPSGNEAYVVPQRYALGSMPDAAALVLVEHSRQFISFDEIFEELGLTPSFAADWQRIRQRASALAP